MMNLPSMYCNRHILDEEKHVVPRTNNAAAADYDNNENNENNDNNNNNSRNRNRNSSNKKDKNSGNLSIK